MHVDLQQLHTQLQKMQEREGAFDEHIDELTQAADSAVACDTPD